MAGFFHDSFQGVPVLVGELFIFDLQLFAYDMAEYIKISARGLQRFQGGV